jgi:hypothetical protein
MTVYVDDAIHPFGRMLMCHCWSNSVEELLAMMKKISVNTKWIQGHPTLSFGKHRNASWVHFDISKGKRDLAIQHGAVAVDRYEALAHCARLDIQSGDPRRVEYGRRRLALVNRSRGISERTFQFRFSASYRKTS